MKPRHLLFLIVTLAAAAALLWPVHAWVTRREPYVLGLPFSLFWIVMVMVVVFVSLWLLFWADQHEGGAGGTDDHAGEGG